LRGKIILGYLRAFDSKLYDIKWMKREVPVLRFVKTGG
jgi:hypothetical protein